MALDLSTLSEETAPISYARIDPASNEAIPVVQKSWDGRKPDAKGVERGTTLGLTVDEKDVPSTVTLLRKAADYIGCGLSVNTRDANGPDGKPVKGKVRVIFAAKTRRANNRSAS